MVRNKSHCGERLSAFAQTSVKVEEVHPTLFYRVSRVGGWRGVKRQAFPIGKRRRISLVQGDFQVFVWICVLARRNRSSPKYQHMVVEDCRQKTNTRICRTREWWEPPVFRKVALNQKTTTLTSLNMHWCEMQKQIKGGTELSTHKRSDDWSQDLTCLN